jgi:hypothetical protein
MQTYYSFTQFFNNVCNAHPNIKTFTHGDLSDVNLLKQELFPIAHLIIDSITVSSGQMTYGCNLLVMDVVRNIQQVADSTGNYNVLVEDYKTNTNIIDVYSSTLSTTNDIWSYVFRNPTALSYNIYDDAVITPFDDRFDNSLAGMSMVFNVVVGNDNNICVTSLDVNLADGGQPAC